MLDRGRSIGASAGIAALVAWLALCVSSDWYETLRERAFDSITVVFARQASATEPIVVDIDRRTLAAWGSSRIPYDKLADLVAAIARHGPAAIGIDVLLEDKLERAVNEEPRQDADARLATALRSGKVVLGLALDPEQMSEPFQLATTPILVRGRLPDLDIWQAPGVIGPPSPLAAAASGLGVLVFSAETDASIRRVPLLVGGGDRLLAGLAVELMRVAAEASTLVVATDPLALQIGATRIPSGNDGLLRLVPEADQRRAARTIPALDVANAAPRLARRIVLIGTSAPELGGLRPAHGGTLVPSVQLHAAAVAQLQSGDIPRRPAASMSWELVAAVLAALTSIAVALVFSPAMSALMVAAVAIGWTVAALAAYAGRSLLVDPLLGPGTVGTAFAASALAMAAETWRRRAALERSLEQRLSPAVARRIARDPTLLKLKGEQRIITALFTDVEGFTAMTERAAPAQLIEVLDSYFEGVSQIIVEQGGMIDKFVGDAVHAFFNAPLDLPDHAVKALAAATAIETFSEAFRARPEVAALGFGRTRIGIETGPAIVGDVGGGRKLDYTAHGNAVNAAARFEAANKQLGTTICIGPGAAILLAPEAIRPIGLIEVRGRSEPQQVYEPWPPTYTDADRTLYLDAGAASHADPHRARAALRALSGRHPRDPVVVRLLREAEPTTPFPTPTVL